MEESLSTTDILLSLIAGMFVVYFLQSDKTPRFASNQLITYKRDGRDGLLNLSAVKIAFIDLEDDAYILRIVLSDEMAVTIPYNTLEEAQCEFRKLLVH